MENPLKKSLGEDKINEYVERIKAGESADKIMTGLPDSFKKALEEKLGLEKPLENSSKTETLKVFKEKDALAEQRKREAEKVTVEQIKEKLNSLMGEKIDHTDELNKVYSEIYFKNRDNITNDAFLFSKGINPETEQPFEMVEGEVGKHFDSHGIAKIGQYEKLIGLLKNGISKDKPFFSAPFSVSKEDKAGLGSGLGTSGGEPYKDGIAVVVADYDKKLSEDGIKFVFINDVYGELKNLLQKQFPNYEFHLLSEQAQVLKKPI